VIRLSAMQEMLTPSGQPATAMLFHLGDRDKADPGFTHFGTGKVRIPLKEEDEAGGLSVHAVISLQPTQPNGFLYRMLYEDVPGFGRTLLQAFLRAEFRKICDDHELTWKRDRRDLKTRPMVELHGHASDQLRDSLEEGRLLNVELVSYVEQDFGFDEGRYIASARRQFNLSVSKGLPEGEGLALVEKLKLWARNEGFKSMRVRWKDPTASKPYSAKVDTARQDAGDAVFVKAAELDLDRGLPDICETMSTELTSKMTALLD
jgi:hypothetical protein